MATLRLDTTKHERNVAVWLNVLAAMSLMPVFLPLIIGIIVWQTNKDGSEFIDDHGKETVNFHISLYIYIIVLSMLSILVLPAFAIVVVYFVGVIAAIRGAVAAGRGEVFRYPICLRFIR